MPPARRTFQKGPLEDLRWQRDDLHELTLAQLARDGSEDTRAARVVGVVDEHGRVLVEGDVGAVLAAELAPGADDDRLDDVSLPDGALRHRALDGSDDHVADAGVAASRPAPHANA